MRVVVTGAGGFVGRTLVRRLLAQGVAGRRVGRLAAMDLSLDGLPPDDRLEALPGDFGDAELLDRAFRSAVDLVVHLASIPGGMAEQQYALARRVNVDATQALLERGQAQVQRLDAPPRVVFASSIAVFGALEGPVDDHTPMRPAMSYGTHKLIGELLVADFTRRGWVDGVSLRLPGVLARPPARTGQLSAFMSDLLRELAAGRPFTCPTSPDATIWASSLPCVVDQLLHAAALDSSRLDAGRALTLPTQRASMAELVDAVARVFGTPAGELVRWAPDARIETLFGRQPPVTTRAAEAAGFRHDGSLDELVRQALQETPT